MTRAGEKLYGDWDKVPRDQRFFASRPFRRGALHMLLLVTALTIALISFG